MKFIILISNLKEISPSVFSWKKKEYIKNYDAILLLKYDSDEEKKITYAFVLKNGVGRYNIFFNFYTKLDDSSFLCRCRVECVNVLVCAMYFFSTNNFAHAQMLYRMRSLCRSYIAGKHWILYWIQENKTVTYFLRSRLFTYDIQDSHYFQIRGRSDFSFREFTGRLLGEVNCN